MQPEPATTTAASVIFSSLWMISSCIRRAYLPTNFPILPHPPRIRSLATFSLSLCPAIQCSTTWIFGFCRLALGARLVAAWLWQQQPLRSAPCLLPLTPIAPVASRPLGRPSRTTTAPWLADGIRLPGRHPLTICVPMLKAWPIVFCRHLLLYAVVPIRLCVRIFLWVCICSARIFSSFSCRGAVARLLTPERIGPWTRERQGTNASKSFANKFGPIFFYRVASGAGGSGSCETVERMRKSWRSCCCYFLLKQQRRLLTPKPIDRQQPIVCPRVRLALLLNITMNALSVLLCFLWGQQQQQQQSFFVCWDCVLVGAAATTAAVIADF